MQLNIHLTQRELEPQQQQQQPTKRGRLFKHIYPLYTTVRLSKNNTDRLKKYGRYGSSIDDCVTTVLDTIETRGYETPKDQRSW